MAKVTTSDNSIYERIDKFRVAKSIFYLTLGFTLYLFLFYKVSSPGSNIMQGVFKIPGPMFWVGLSVVIVSSILTFTTVIKKRSKRVSFYLARSIAFMTFEMAMTSLIGLTLLQNGYPQLNLNSWILFSVSTSFTVFAMLSMNIIVLRGKEGKTMKLILLPGNNSQRLTFISTIFVFVLFIFDNVHLVHSLRRTLDITLFWLFAIFVTIIYIRTAIKIRANSVESKYMKTLHNTMPFPIFVGLLWFIVTWWSFDNFNNSINSWLNTSGLFAIIGISIIIGGILLSISLKYLIYRSIKRKTHFKKYLDINHFEYYEIPTFISLIVIAGINAQRYGKKVRYLKLKNIFQILTKSSVRYKPKEKPKEK